MLRVTTNRGLDGKFKKLEDMIDGYRDAYLSRMSSEIVLNSPVDTGTYIKAHNLGPSAVNLSKSSRKKERNQPWQENADKALKKLWGQAKSESLKGLNNVVFSNAAYHWQEVEYEHGYFVYTKAAREHKRIAQEAAQDVKR